MANNLIQLIVRTANDLDEMGLEKEAGVLDSMLEKLAYDPGEEAYVYKADLICKECGDKVKAELTAQGKAPADPSNERSFDSDQFPKGPYPEGGGEADSPHHCGMCEKFLANPLTSDGEKYVLEAAQEGGIPLEWQDEYSYLFGPEGYKEPGIN